MTTAHVSALFRRHRRCISEQDAKILIRALAYATRPPQNLHPAESAPLVPWEPCPPWCIESHEHDTADDFLHMSEMETVPCAVATFEAGHVCGRTRCSMPEYNEPFCEDPVFANIIADKSGVTIEIGHGEDILPTLTPREAVTFGSLLIGLGLRATARSAA